MSNFDVIRDKLKSQYEIVPKVDFAIDHHSGGAIVRTSKDAEGVFHYLFYPKPSHIDEFLKAQQVLDPLGPTSFYPGIVGCISVKPNGFRERKFLIKYIQGGYHTKDSAKSEKFNNKALRKTLASKYRGWQHSLVDQLYADAVGNKVRELTFSKKGFEHLTSFRSKLFRDTALKNGYESVEGSVLRLKRPSKFNSFIKKLTTSFK